MIEFEQEQRLGAKIKVVGVGGGGGNAINTMIKANLQGVEFVSANTDAQALAENLAPTKIHLGERGLGAGADPSRGRSNAEETRERLQDELAGADMVFVTAGLGGGTGTGASPVVAEVAKESGALTVAVVTKPFSFEGAVRQRQAEEGLDQLHDVVDTLIAIPNDRLLMVAGADTTITDAFKTANDVLLNAVQGISDLITVNGLINLDFADVRTTMNEMGMALMGTGRARGDNRAVVAAKSAISNPLLEELSIKGARALLINVTGSNLGIHEINEATSLIKEEVDANANIIFGSVIQDGMEDEIKITVIATGLLDPTRRRREPQVEEPADNVTPLRPPDRDLIDQGEPGELTVADQQPAPRAERDDLLSPFEDELDVPAFIRRGNKGGSTEHFG